MKDRKWGETGMCRTEANHIMTNGDSRTHKRLRYLHNFGISGRTVIASDVTKTDRKQMGEIDETV